MRGWESRMVARVTERLRQWEALRYHVMMPRHMPPSHLSVSLACLIATLGSHVVQSPPPKSAAPRIVAVGDVHGAGPGLAQILQAAGLIDGSRRWTGGTARLVQTGDFLDRGA